MTDQLGESVNGSRLRVRAAWQNTVLTTFTCRRFLEDDRSLVWKSIISVIETFKFFFVGAAFNVNKNVNVRHAISVSYSWVFWMSVGRSWKIFNAATRSQCSLVRTGVCDRFSLYRKPPVGAERVEDSLQLPEFFGGCSIGNGVTVVYRREPTIELATSSIHPRLWRKALTWKWAALHTLYPRDCWMRACLREICQSFSLLIASNFLLHIQYCKKLTLLI